MSDKEMVNHPSHYNRTPIEAKEIIKLVLNSHLCNGMTHYQAFCIGNDLKYRLRAGEKGDIVEDISKGKKYIEFGEFDTSANKEKLDDVVNDAEYLNNVINENTSNTENGVWKILDCNINQEHTGWILLRGWEIIKKGDAVYSSDGFMHFVNNDCGMSVKDIANNTYLFVLRNPKNNVGDWVDKIKKFKSNNNSGSVSSEIINDIKCKTFVEPIVYTSDIYYDLFETDELDPFNILDDKECAEIVSNAIKTVKAYIEDLEESNAVEIQ